MTNLTRRDWLKSSALGALALALGLWPEEEPMPRGVGRPSPLLYYTRDWFRPFLCVAGVMTKEQAERHAIENQIDVMYTDHQTRETTVCEWRKLKKAVNLQARIEGMERFTQALDELKVKLREASEAATMTAYDWMALDEVLERIDECQLSERT